MFDIGWSELVLIGIVALIVIGPKELPGALRTLGQWMSKIRRMASEFQGQFQDAMREAELADLKKEVEDMTAQASSYTRFEPLDDARKEIESAVGDVPALEGPVSGATSPGKSADQAAGDTQPTPAASDSVPAAKPAPPSEPKEETVAAESAAAKPDAGGRAPA